MLRLASFDVVFQEIPGEVTLALNLSGCPNRCAGCHSPHLWEEVGEPLDDNLLNSLLSGYGLSLIHICGAAGVAAGVSVRRVFVRPEQAASVIASSPIHAIFVIGFRIVCMLSGCGVGRL